MRNYIFSHFVRGNPGDEFSFYEGNDDLRVFLYSKILNVPNSKLLFFTNFSCKKTYNDIEFVNVKSFPYTFHGGCSRWCMYLNYLESHNFEEDSAFVFCDCRDVFFQRSPFELLKSFPQNLVILGNESRSICLNTQSHNRSWIALQDVCNPYKFGGQLVICSGTLIVRGVEMAKLFLQMYSCLLKYHFNVKHKVDVKNQYDIIDQGVLNELYYNFLVNYGNNVMLFRNEHNPFFIHLAVVPPNEWSIEWRDNSAVFTSYNGVSPCILHQYDRNGALINATRTQTINKITHEH